MKAYLAWDSGMEEFGSTVVFAENRQEAKKIAFGTEACEDTAYIDVRVARLPQMDEHYRGYAEIDWYNPEDRKALVGLGWTCEETSWECDTCEARHLCSKWEDEE